MNQVAIIRTDETFRETAADHMKQYADETLHQLLDRYISLTSQIVDGADDGKPTPATLLLAKERRLVNEVASTVHGYSFEFNGAEPGNAYW